MGSGLLQDLRYAVRRIAHAPAMAAAVVATLTLAIGANAALFSLLNAIVLRRVSAEDPGRLVVLQATEPTTHANRSIYHTAFVELAKLPVFEHLALYAGGGIFHLEARGVTTEGLIEASTPGLLEALGVRPQVGRFFTSADASGEAAGGGVVISHRVWRRLFNADPAAVGEVVLIDGVPARVIGVTPAAYSGLYVHTGIGFSVPLSFLSQYFGQDPKRPLRGLNAIGRLAPGVSIEQARAAVVTAWPGIRATTVPPGVDPTEQTELLTHAIGLESVATGFSMFRGQYEQPLLLVSGIAAVLLVIGCVNLSGLLLARAVGRERQFAIVLALGASRWRVARQLLIEHAILCALGGGLAIGVAWWTTSGAAALLWRGNAPLAQPLTPDRWVLAACLLVTLALTLVVSLAPAWTVTRARAQQALRAGRTVAHGGRRWTRVLLAAQIALSLALLIGAGLLGSSLMNLRGLPVGIEPSGLRWTRLAPVTGGYEGMHDATYYPELARRLSEVPGVQSVAMADSFPVLFSYAELVRPELVSRAGAEDTTQAVMEPVSPRFFETVGITLLRGRDFTAGDVRDRPPVAVISESLSRRLFMGRDPIGQRITIGADPSRASVEVIGVVSNAAIADYKHPERPVVFRPQMQDARSPRSPVVLYRGTGDPAAIDAGIAAAVASLGREVPGGTASMEEHIHASLLRERLLAGLSGLFAVIALVLSMVGLYGALAFSVVSRTRELGVRLALGETRAGVARLVVADGLRVVCWGILSGVPLALAGSRISRSWLFGVEPASPWIIGGAVAAFVTVAVLATWWPARRASATDPAVVLRAD